MAVPSLFSPRRVPAALVLGGLLVATTGCTAVATDTPTTAPAAAHWSYEGADGPAEWGALSDEWATCSAGTAQSPIDLPAAVLAPSANARVAELDVSPDRDAGRGTVADNGHTVQFTPTDDDASTVEFGGVDYDLAQMHFHAPSEHTIDGKPAAAEFHFVHRSESGALLVVGVLAAKGAASPAYEPFVQAAATSGTTARPVAIDLAAVLPSTSGAYTYEGSLTTPPCSEGVRWVVAAQPITLSAAQIAELEKAHDHSARPVQPRGERSVDGLMLRVDAR